MNDDDFLNILREEPRPEFREALEDKLKHQPARNDKPRRLWFGLAGVAAAIVVLVAGLGAYLTNGDDSDDTVDAPERFAVSPSGADVPRLTPIRVQFARPPAERDPEKLLVLNPRPAGDYVWVDDRTLLFQPAYPGLDRGKEYHVTVPPQPDAGLASAQQVSFTTEGPLVVDTVVPAPDDVEVPANAQVLVQFSRSVAPLTVLSAQSTTPVISFSPPLSGKGEWLNTSVYRFVPDSLAADTTYTATIAAGLTSAVDGVLQKDYSWKFTTFGPSIDAINPEDGSKFASLKQPVTVLFNQPMDRTSTAGLKVADGVSGAVVPGQTSWNDAGTVLTFVPSGTLESAHPYTLTVAEKLPSANGTLTKTGRSATFSTVPKPAVARTEPADGSSNANRYGITIQFAGPMDAETFDGRVSVTGFSQDDVDQSLSIGDTQMNIGLALKPSTSYRVAIAAGVKDRYGQALPPFAFAFTTGALPPTLSFAVPGQVVTYSSSTEPILVFHSANRDTASFTLFPLTADEAKTIQQANGLNTKDGFTPSLPAVRSWTERLTNKQDELSVNSTSLSGGGPLPKGDYYVVSGGGGFNSELMFSVVDTAIVLKLGPDSLLAWVVDLDSGKPVASAEVRVEGDSVPAGTKATTDASGLATFTLPPVDPQRGYRTGLLVSTFTGGRYGVASTDWRRGVEPFQLGIPQEYYQAATRLIGFIYTDRAIYRPGEEMNFKAIVRRDDDALYTIPTDGPDLTYTIYSSQGKELTSGKVTLNSYGTFAASFTLPSDAEPGSYGISLSWTEFSVARKENSQQQIAGNSFLVAEFRVPEFQVGVTTPETAYASGDTIDATVTAGFFFGGQVPGATVNWTAMSSPYAPRFEGFEQYAFGDNDSFFRRDPFQRSVVNDPKRATGSGVTGADGQLEFTVPAELRGDETAQQFTISATVTDQGGQAVAGSTVVTVNPADIYAGLRTDEYIASAGKPTDVQLVSVGTEGKPLPGRNVTLQVYERKWVTTKESTSGGARTYRSEPVDTLVDTLSATTGNDGKATIAVTPERAGSLRLVASATDSRGRTAKSATYLWVSSGEFASWYFSNDDAMNLIPDKTSYEVGDTASLLVPAPFGDAIGLVTVERSKIHSATVQAFTSNSTVITVPITAHSVPNIFVSTVLYRPPTAADPIPRYKVGYAELPVSTKTRVLNVAIKPDRAQSKPGETVHYDITVTDNDGKPVQAELSVAVVDKAVVSLADERGPDGLRSFWFERGLGIATASSLAVSVDRSNDVIQEPRQGKGGGGVDDERLRQEFKNTAFWQPQLLTDGNGHASVDVKMPDNLTTWRMQVRAVSGDTLVGEGTNELLSTQPLLLRPSLPRFVRTGDRFELRLLVRNGTLESRDVDVTVQATGVDLGDSAARKVTVPAGQSTLVSWPASVSAEGEVQVTFRASSGGVTADSVVQKFPALHDLTPETMSTGGVVKDTPRTEAIYLPPYAITAGGSLGIAVQASLTGLLGAELTPFAPPPVPWDATEDTSSIAARVVATGAVIRSTRVAGGDTSSYEKQLDTDLARLVLRQNADGGWRWCTICGESNPWVTNWALLAFAEARRANKSFDATVVSRAASYLQGYLGRSTDIQHPQDPNEKARMLYAIAAAGEGTSVASALQALFEQQRTALDTKGKAWTLLGLVEAGQARTSPSVQALLGDLTAAVVPSANGNHWESAASPATSAYANVYSSDSIETTAAAVAALATIDPSHPLIEESVRWVMSARRTQGWTGGLGGALSLSSLATFALGTGELTGNSSYNVDLGGDPVLKGSVKGTDPSVQAASVPLSELTPGKVSVLQIDRSGAAKARLYYALNLSYLTPAKEVDALNRGVAISHEYTALDSPSKPITSAKLGDIVRVKVEILAPAELREVRVEDFLPAGFEPIDASLKTTDPALIQQLDAERRAATGGDEPPYYAPWYRWYRSPFDQASLRDDRVVLNANALPKGVHEYIYYVRATTVGDFFVAPAHAEEAQFPEVFGRSDSSRFTVTP